MAGSSLAPGLGVAAALSRGIGGPGAREEFGGDFCRLEVSSRAGPPRGGLAAYLILTGSRSVAPTNPFSLSISASSRF